MTLWEAEAEADEAAFWAEVEEDDRRWEAELDAAFDAELAAEEPERLDEVLEDEARYPRAVAPHSAPAVPEPIRRAIKVVVAAELLRMLTGR